MSKSRKKKQKEQGHGISKEQWEDCLEFFSWRCAYSGKKLNEQTKSKDHIIPISKDGQHEIWNIVPMYVNYNNAKGNQDMEEWYRKQPYFSEERLEMIYLWQGYSYNKYYIGQQQLEINEVQGKENKKVEERRFMRKCEKCGNHEFAYDYQNTKVTMSFMGFLLAGLMMWIPIIGWVLVPFFLLMGILAPFLGKKVYTGKCLKCGAVVKVEKEEAEQFKNE